MAQIEKPSQTEAQIAALQVQPAEPNQADRENALARAVQIIRNDSRRAPENYLAETIVPFGGE